MRKFLVLLCIALLWVVPVSAQLFRYLDTNDGLSSRRVISLEKDRREYMWFLTHEGIDKYDGKQFVHYKLIDDDQSIQQFPNLHVIQTDSHGEIWALGKDGRAFQYNPKLDKFILRVDLADTLHTNNRLPLTYIRIDNEDNLWMCTKNAQYVYRISTHTLKRLESPISEEITCLVQGKDNQYFIGTNHNIYIAELEGNRLNARRNPLLDHFHIIHHLYYHHPTQKLLIGTLMDGFYLYCPYKGTLEELGNMKDVNINAVIPYLKSEEEVLIATDGNGVYKLNLETKQLHSSFSVDYHYANKMNGEIIKDIYQDGEGRIWMAVFPLGITVYSDKYPSYELVKHSQDNPNSLISNHITYVLEDSDGDVWFATSNGICLYNVRTRKWTSMLSSYQQEKEEQNYVYISLCEAEPGIILVGGYMSGMYLINKKDMVPRYFTPQSFGYKDIRPDKYIRSIYRDKEGSVWAGGYYNLKRIDPKTFTMEHYNMEYPVTFITSKNEEELWIGTINGVYLFNKKKKQVEPVSFSSDIGNVNTIYQDGEYLTYIGTSGKGLFIYDEQTGKLENYSSANSALICNNIYSILPGNVKNELIFSTENELVCFMINERIFLNWTKEQGLLASNFNPAAGVNTSGGVYVFGSGNGAVILRDNMELPRVFDSKLVFTAFNIHYQEVLPDMEESSLKEVIDETDEIILSHDQNIFSINVASINYDCPSRVLYSWKLEGFYDDWTDPVKTNFIRYTNINPGEYTLRVRTILMDDWHTIEERSIKITITPPFTRTIWALLIYIVIVILVAFGIMRILWMRKEANASKDKIQFFINTAHDIRTPLTLIKAPLSDLNRNELLSEQGQLNLELAMRSTDKLSELATKLIDFQKEELYTSNVNVVSCDVNQYVDDFLSQFKLYAFKKNITMEFDGTDEKLEAWIDRNKLDSIIHNLVGNALKYTPEGGHINVKLRKDKECWVLIIADTGIGIAIEDQKKMFKHLFRGDNAVNLQITGTGIGMLQTYRLVKRHLGKISVSSKENEGTVFTLRFPIWHKRYKLNTECSKENSQIVTQTEGAVQPTFAPKTDTPIATILVVEDNVDLRNFLVQSLADFYEVMEAENGQEALDRIKEHQPDLVLSDIMMPVMRGDDLCRVLKNNVETSHIPVILLTALNDHDSIIRGLETKADNYVIKPFEVDILKANIANVLANRETIRQRFSKMNYRTDDLREEVPGVDLDQEFLMKVTDIVKQHLDHEFNVDTLCGKLHMSRSSFYNKIKALTGHSPSDFVRHIRMNEAAYLLKTKKLSVAEVSDKLGYGDPKYFTDTFKKHYGVTPSAYIKQENAS